MKKLTVIVVFLLLNAQYVFGADRDFKAIKLLAGYHCSSEKTVDTTSWIIEGKNGFLIHFEAGFSEGLAADPAKKQQYEWYREQNVNGRTVLVALTKRGLKTVHDAIDERNLPPGNVLLVTFPLEGDKNHAANFVGRVANSEELADMLLMALTFDPSEGSF